MKKLCFIIIVLIHFTNLYSQNFLFDEIEVILNEEDSEKLVDEFIHTINSQGIKTFNTIIGSQYRLEISWNLL